jgi:hypothetical protein
MVWLACNDTHVVYEGGGVGLVPKLAKAAGPIIVHDTIEVPRADVAELRGNPRKLSGRDFVLGAVLAKQDDARRQ